LLTTLPHVLTLCPTIKFESGTLQCYVPELQVLTG